MFQKLSDENRKLAYYQEQCYLLDPYLDDLVTPIAARLREHARAFTSGETGYSTERVDRLAWMLYYFVKFRGYKTIGPFTFAFLLRCSCFGS